MKKNTFNLTNTFASTGRIGYVLPIRFDFVLPNDEIKIRNNFFIKFSPLTTETVGAFEARLRTFFVPISQIWTNFYNYYNTSIANFPCQNITVPAESYQNFTSTLQNYVYYYMGITMNASTNNVNLNVNALPIRAYVKCFRDWIVPRQYNSYAETTWPLSTGDTDATYNNILRDFYSNDYYSQMLYNNILSILPTLPLNAKIDDFKNWLANTRLRLLQLEYKHRIRDYFKELFKLEENTFSDRVKLLDAKNYYLVMNETPNTNAAATAPLGLSQSIFELKSKSDEINFKAGEFGYIIQTLSVVPVSNYYYGVNQEMLRNEIIKVETDMNQLETVNRSFMSAHLDDGTIMGYLPRYYELKHKRNVMGGMMSTSSYKQFLLTMPEDVSDTNLGFFQVDPDHYDSYFALSNYPQFRIYVVNEVEAKRYLTKPLTYKTLETLVEVK